MYAAGSETMKRILFILGPNLNMVGIRDVNTYGTQTAESINNDVRAWAEEMGIELEIFQSNHEGEIIDQIQESLGWADGIVINPGAYTHTSIAIADALRAIEIPTVEVHLSDTDKREDFRKISYVEAVAVKTIKGKGFEGYKEAIDFLAEEWKKADI